MALSYEEIISQTTTVYHEVYEMLVQKHIEQDQTITQNIQCKLELVLQQKDIHIYMIQTYEIKLCILLKFCYRNGSLIVKHAVITIKDDFVARTLSRALVDITQDSSLTLFGENIYVKKVLIGGQESKSICYTSQKSQNVCLQCYIDKKKNYGL